MNSKLLFVAASLMLIGATVAVAIPNPVQADPPHEWCHNFFGGDCFKSKGECRKEIPAGITATCVKSIVP